MIELTSPVFHPAYGLYVELGEYAVEESSLLFWEVLRLDGPEFREGRFGTPCQKVTKRQWSGKLEDEKVKTSIEEGLKSADVSC